MKISIIRTIEPVFKLPTKTVVYHGADLEVPADTKFLVVDGGGVIIAYPHEPEYKGHWVCIDIKNRHRRLGGMPVAVCDIRLVADHGLTGSGRLTTADIIRTKEPV